MKQKFIAIVTTLFLVVSFAPHLAHADELSGLTLETEMRAMIEMGIIQGYGDDDFRPKGEVTREQFAAFLARTLELPNQNSSFKDVSPSSALAQNIGAIQQTGLMTGTTDNRFMPTKAITREEMALTMSRVLDYKQLTVESQNVQFSDGNKFTLTGGIEAAKKLATIQVMSGAASGTAANTFVFNPKSISTRDQVAAVLYRYLAYQNNGVVPEPEKPEKPEVGVNPFKVASIRNGELTYAATTYKTYAEALKAYEQSPNYRALVKGNQIIKIKSGRAFSAKNPKNYTSIYSDPTFRNEVTYVQHGRELKHVGSGPDYAIVMAAGTTGYVRHSEVDLVPDELVKGRNHYKNVGGALIHYTYDYLSDRYASYTVGPAPSFMQPNGTYYSFDNVHYYNENNQAVGRYYPYFQYVSVRTATTYTAEELDLFIDESLAKREAMGLAKYKDATKKSKLLGLGKHLKAMEQQHRVNAMFILAVAIHESDYGTSANAYGKNNLFGIRVYDSAPEQGLKFPKPADSVTSFVEDYMNKNYVNPQGAYANGAVPGNKTVGVNVKYASDPDWGSKVAGHLWAMDTALGGQEHQRHQLAMIDYYHPTAGVNIRTAPQGDLLFTYKPKDPGHKEAFSYPLVIVDEEMGKDGYLWYQVVADINPKANNKTQPTLGWIRSDLVKKIQ